MPMFDLASYLPYLVNRVGARLAEAFSGELADLRITLPMWRVMAALCHKGGQRVGELAEMTSIEVSTLSRLLRAMERKELVRRARSSEDARTVLVELTDAGVVVTACIVPRARLYQDLALRGFTPAESELLKAMLVRVHENLGALPARRSAFERSGA
jgi:DNA-binding MarR family transcriptional regulator